MKAPADPTPADPPQARTTGRRAWRRRAALPAVVALAVLAPLAVHWLAGRTLAWFDTQILYAPQRWLVDEALRDLRLPLWNPHMGGGMPFLADSIHGVLHPISVLVAWLGTGRSIDLLIGGYVACAGLGAAWLARELGASRTGAAVAGVAFGASGHVLSMAGNLVFLAGLGSLPAALAGLRRLAGGATAGRLALAVAATAALALSGDAQALMVGGAFGLALAWEAGGWRGAARAAAGGAAGLLVAGIQLVPTAAHLPRTVRAAGLWQATPGVWALEPWRLPELVLPGLCWSADPFVEPVFEALAGPGAWPTGNLPIPFVASVFVGVVPLTLAAAGARVRRRGPLLAGLAALALWVALGPALGADAVLGHVPVWRAFRYAEKLVGPLTLAVALLAGLGLDELAARRCAGRWAFGVAAALALAALGAVWLVAGRLPPAVGAEAGARLLRGSWSVVGGTAALGAWLLLRRRLGEAGGRATLAALVWISMAAAAPAALRPGDPEARLRAPGPALRAPPPGPRLVVPYTHEPLALPTGADWIDQAGREHAALGYPAYNVRGRLDSLTVCAGMDPTQLALVAAAFMERWPAAARRYGVTHLVLDEPVTPAQRRLHAIATSGGRRVDDGAGALQVWEVPHRAWAAFPGAAAAVDSPQQALLETFRSDARGSGAVVVETAGEVEVAPGRVLSLARGREWLRVEAESDQASLLVVADAWWPGWEASIDGAPAPILRADALLRAVRWPAGRHVLEMRYAPPEVAWGGLASALGLALAGGWAWRLRRRSSQTASAASSASPSPETASPARTSGGS